MEIVVHSKNSLFELKFQKKLYHFNRHELGFITYVCDVKSDSIGFPESKSDKKSDSNSWCNQESDNDSTQKPPIPTPQAWSCHIRIITPRLNEKHRLHKLPLLC